MRRPPSPGYAFLAGKSQSQDRQHHPFGLLAETVKAGVISERE
jgi:hypothetical protein